MAGKQIKAIDSSRLPVSGTCKTCDWEIDEKGTLTVRPSDGTSGEIDLPPKHPIRQYPWQRCANLITTIIIAPGVKALSGYGLFRNCTNLKTVDLSGLDTSSVTNMCAFFANCSSLTQLNLSGIDTSSVTEMSSMFQGCSSLDSLDLSGFDTSSVKNMECMFCYCKSLTTLDLSSFKISKANNLSSMFSGCSSLETLIFPNLKASKKRSLFQIFDGCSEELRNRVVANLKPLASGECGTCDWEIAADGRLTISPSNGTAGELSSDEATGFPWAEYCKAISSVIIAPGVKAFSCRGMFQDCSEVFSIDLLGLDTSAVTDMSYMFHGCARLHNTIDLSNINTTSVTNMSHMFHNCQYLGTLDLSRFDTSSVVDMSGMFSACFCLENLNLSSFDTTHVTKMQNMFSQCEKLTSLDLSGFDISSVTNLSRMFYKCHSLHSLNFPFVEISEETNTYQMAEDCAKPLKEQFGELSKRLPPRTRTQPSRSTRSHRHARPAGTAGAGRIHPRASNK